MSRTGIWLVGACGSVATTAVIGAAAIKAGLTGTEGCVSCLPPFDGVDLPAFDELVFGGHDVIEHGLAKRAEQLVRSRIIPENLLNLVRDDLNAAEAEIRPGADDPAEDSTERLVEDLRSFRDRLGLDRVVVVNVASTEAPATHVPGTLADLKPEDLAPSSRYAYAAFLAGCAFVDFTPSTGIRVPALDELARREGLPYAGSDGKTGETLVKAALAPMFWSRGLRVTSWSGANLLGAGDGATLADPARAASKTGSKRQVLAGTLGYEVQDDVTIRNVPAMGDWKTAWDHITFDGFLGVGMTMQFTWQGCDSALAAPLVLDLARFAAAAHAAGLSGPIPELAFFFKDPVGTQEHGLARQFDLLCAWAQRLSQ